MRALAKAEQTFIPNRMPVLAMHFNAAALLQPGRLYMLGVRVKVRCCWQPLDAVSSLASV